VRDWACNSDSFAPYGMLRAPALPAAAALWMALCIHDAMDNSTSTVG
jgi:hypothetical protein